MGPHFPVDIRSRFGPNRASLGPNSPRMQHIPSRAHALVTTLPRIVVPKTVDQVVPDRRELRDHQGLAQGNPDIVNDEKAATEIINAEVRNGTNAFSMLAKAVEKWLAAIA